MTPTASTLRHDTSDCTRRCPPEEPHAKEVDLYDGHYGYIAADPQVAVRRETYDVDLGQASWITLGPSSGGR